MSDAPATHHQVHRRAGLDFLDDPKETIRRRRRSGEWRDLGSPLILPTAHGVTHGDPEQI